MPEKSLFNRTFDARPDRIDFRDLPYRPRLVSLPDRYPAPDQIAKFFPRYCADDMVLDQGEEGSCTGFGLATVVNYLRWEIGLSRPADPAPKAPAPRVSARMLYQNARLYDEWRGKDYDGSSCRGAMKGFHKHGVCSETYWPNFAGKKPGEAREGWDENAPLTPLGAYYRVDSRALIDLQSAIFETHAIYVSADVHDGWTRVGKCKRFEDALIPPPRKSDRGGHAFAVVGYTPDGFIVQNSWGSAWGYNGFALLPYEDWTRHGSDAWALALGAPMRVTLAHDAGSTSRRKFRSPNARAEISLDERLRAQGQQLESVADDPSAVSPWVEGEEFKHIVFIGHNGSAERELVAANDGDHAVRIVVEDGIKNAAANGLSHVAIYDHGGLNDRAAGINRARVLGPWLVANGIFPIFVVWQTGFLESAGDIIKTGLEKLGLPAPVVEGWVLEKLNEVKDRAFEVFARDAGVKAIWENMKNRAAGAVSKDGGLTALAKSLRKALDAQNKKPTVHLLGHSAGAIMQGHFLSIMKAKQLSADTVHLWAPACTVPFATASYGAAFAKGVADPKTTFISVLSDENEKSDPCVPVLYSKSLLYLVSRALEAEHKSPILGMEKVWPKWSKDDGTFMDGYAEQLDAWYKASKNVQLDSPIVKSEVPTRREKNKVETIDANHGSFDNNINVVNLAIERIIGKKPKVPVTDLRGF